ncbi:hypothetical protein L2E82_31611 [Cichorium intybus]|uniref:Uncharacterized protein n=1 Tax=Cichorium intybus TaxID=13427 RepID=A0ACB9BEI6_CICIN|nr:hypothetical protein L2E82_31611 [Cichorium intybus]
MPNIFVPFKVRHDDPPLDYSATTLSTSSNTITTLRSHSRHSSPPSTPAFSIGKQRTHPSFVEELSYK